ncbi:MAG TPA: HDOD domain-containing protein, partial [Fimbriimonadaceae bacterium]|nr:HDOD domain-containing protein [Fimbriimonadaceae bacterium]
MSALPAGQGNEAVEIVLASTKEVAVLPQVVYKIMEMTSSTDSSAAMLERAIIIDPGFSTKILTQANSAYYALPRKVTSIKEAVAFLGFRAVRQLAMAVGVFDLFLGKTDAESIRRRGWWRHSLDTAL